MQGPLALSVGIAHTRTELARWLTGTNATSHHLAGPSALHSELSLRDLQSFLKSDLYCQHSRSTNNFVHSRIVVLNLGAC